MTNAWTLWWSGEDHSFKSTYLIFKLFIDYIDVWQYRILKPFQLSTFLTFSARWDKVWGRSRGSGSQTARKCRYMDPPPSSASLHVEQRMRKIPRFTITNNKEMLRYRSTNHCRVFVLKFIHYIIQGKPIADIIQNNM